MCSSAGTVDAVQIPTTRLGCGLAHPRGHPPRVTDRTRPSRAPPAANSTRYWSDSTHSSCDGVRVRVGVNAANADRNAAYFGPGRGVTIYGRTADFRVRRPLLEGCTHFSGGFDSTCHESVASLSQLELDEAKRPIRNPQRSGHESHGSRVLNAHLLLVHRKDLLNSIGKQNACLSADTAALIRHTTPLGTGPPPQTEMLLVRTAPLPQAVN